LQPDPLGYAGGDLNLYSYVGNDGANLVDPLGLSNITITPSIPFTPIDWNLFAVQSEGMSNKIASGGGDSAGGNTGGPLATVPPGPNLLNPLEWLFPTQAAYAYPKHFPIPEDFARKKTPGLLKRNFPSLTQGEANQLSEHILNKLNWSHLKMSDLTLIAHPPATLKDISPDVKKRAIIFLNGLPAEDQPSVKKIIQILQPAPSPPGPSPSAQPGTGA
jgi:hypothetical protein